MLIFNNRPAAFDAAESGTMFQGDSGDLFIGLCSCRTDAKNEGGCVAPTYQLLRQGFKMKLRAQAVHTDALLPSREVP